MSEEFRWTELYGICGVYQLQCGFTNRRYIGSSTDIGCRISKHLYLLRRIRHSNKDLQAVYGKFGEDNLMARVLVECGEAQLLEEERRLIEELGPEMNRVFPESSGFGSSARNAKRYLVTDPSGRQFEVVNLERFCRENGLGTTGLHKVANGKAKQYKGWLCEHCQEQNASDHSRQ